MTVVPNRIADRTQPRAVVPTPTYFRPEAKITNVMAGRMYLSVLARR